MKTRKMIRPGWAKVDGGWSDWPKEAIRAHSALEVRCKILDPHEVRMLWQWLGGMQAETRLDAIIEGGRA